MNHKLKTAEHGVKTRCGREISGAERQTPSVTGITKKGDRGRRREKTLVIQQAKRPQRTAASRGKIKEKEENSL